MLPTFITRAVSFLNSLFSGNEVEIFDDANQKLRLQTGGQSLVIDGRQHTVSLNGRVVARFDEVKFVHIRQSSANADHPPEWFVVMHVGLFRNIHVGRTRDDAQASIVAARIATVMGKRVSAWK